MFRPRRALQMAWVVILPGCGQPIVDYGPSRDYHATLLDRLIEDVLTNADVAHARSFYGMPGSRRFVLVPGGDVPWPADYEPVVEGWVRDAPAHQGGSRPEAPRLMGLRVDRMDLDGAPEPLRIGNVTIRIHNIGGGGGGPMPIGACFCYYDVAHDGHHWRIEFKGAMDP